MFFVNFIIKKKQLILMKKEFLKKILGSGLLTLRDETNYITIDLGGTNCRASLRDESGNTFQENIVTPIYTSKTKGKSRKDVLKTIYETMQPYLELAHKKLAILIAVPGIVKNNKVKQLPNLNIKEWDLKSDLKEYLKDKITGEIQIKILNDLEAAWHCEAKDKKDLVVYAGTGIGGAINGKNIELGRNIVLTKENGEITSAKYKDNTNKLEKNEYLLEELASGMSLKKHAEEQGIKLKAKTNEYGEKLAEEARKGDLKAKATIAKTGINLGIGLASYNTYNEITNAVIGGSLGLNEDYFQGIITGLKKAEELNLKQLAEEKVRKSHYNSSEAIFRGLIKKFK